MSRFGRHPALIVLALSALAAPALGDPSAGDIMEHNFLTSKVTDSTSVVTFRLRNATGQERVRLTSGPSKLIPGTTDNRRLITFDAPSDIRGTRTLLIEHTGADDDMWIYLPAMKKVRRLVASNKRDSFVGTDFSYGDVIGHKAADWVHSLAREAKEGGRDCYVVVSVPRTQEVQDTSGYSKRISWVDMQSWVAVRTDIYDSGGDLLKRILAEDIREVDPISHKWQAMKQTASNLQTGHSTTIEFTKFKANVGISDSVFTPRSLED